MAQELNFAWPVTAMAYEDFKELDDLLKQNAALFFGKRIIVFGAGIRGSLFAAILENLGYADFSFVDNNQDKWGGFINSHPIKSPQTLEKEKGRSVIIISVENWGTIKNQLTAHGWRNNFDFFAVQTSEYERYAHDFANPEPIEYLFLGDCGLSQISLYDNKTDSLGVMLKNKLGADRTKLLAMHGMGMRSYYNIFKWQLELGLKPSILFLMVNFEIFTGRHHLLPRTQHAPLFEKIKHLDPENLEKQEYAQLTEERSRQLIADVSSAAVSAADEHANARLVLKMNYMYRLRENTEDMEYMFKIITLAKENSIKVIPFIPPVNYMYAEKICGDDFIARYQRNLKNMKIIIEKCGIEALDLSFILPDTHFAAPTTIDETANHDGREIIIMHMLKRLHSSLERAF